jgi:hypothetical protein
LTKFLLFSSVDRTSLFPGEGQAWRRLSLVNDMLGNHKQAEDAKYMAWQLGIGQGGFGGPK